MTEHESKGHEGAHEHAHENKHEKKEVTVKKSTLKLVSVAIIMLVVGLAAGAVAAGALNKNTGSSGPGPVLAKEAVGQKIVDYLNKNVVPAGTSLSLNSTEESGPFYVINTLYQGKDIPVYATKDGAMVFLSSPLLTNETIPNNPVAQDTGTIPKAATPNVELFVMSFCPYGVQAEDAMKPVVDLMGPESVKVRFIVNIGGNTTGSVQSLHGTNEAMEDLRQVCIMKYYPDNYWAYVTDFNQQCNSKLRDDAGLDACWKSVAGNMSFNVSQIDTCSKGQEGLALLRADEQLSDSYGVTGSPTLKINGVSYSGARTADAFKQAICSGYENPPAVCGSVLNSTAAAAQGGCGV
jgi:hypothetical protein